MNLKQSIKNKSTEFLTLCNKHNVASIHTFGSSLTANFNEKTSDFDLIVEIDNEDPINRGLSLMALWDKLEELFQRKVDLVTNASIKNPILRKNIDATKTLIYDGKSQKVHL